MKFPTKYTLALQILSICYLYNNEKITSGFIANHTGADASIIRYTMLDLKKRNLIDSKPGPGGTTLNCDLSKISLYDVYELVSEPTETTLKYYDFPETATAIDKEIKKATQRSVWRLYYGTQVLRSRFGRSLIRLILCSA